jgi:hypothetical protein
MVEGTSAYLCWHSRPTVVINWFYRLSLNGGKSLALYKVEVFGENVEPFWVFVVADDEQQAEAKARQEVIKVIPRNGANVELQAEVKDTLHFFLFRKDMIGGPWIYAEG